MIDSARYLEQISHPANEFPIVSKERRKERGPLTYISLVNSFKAALA